MNGERVTETDGGLRGLRVLLVPLSDAPRENPSDRRRLLLPSRSLESGGIRFSFVSRGEALDLPADVIYSQDRDYDFWIGAAPRLASRGVKLVFSFSDALGYTAWSHAHHYDAYRGTAGPVPAERWRSFERFLNRCCMHAVAGSAVQAGMIARFAPRLAVSVLHDAIDTEVYAVPPGAGRTPRPEGGLTLYWEGCSDNLPYLLVCAEAVRNLARRMPVRVLLATTEERRNEFMGTRSNRRLAEMMLGEIAEFHVWRMETVAGLMARADAGLAPLFTDCQFAAAKPPNKAVICNWMKLPVIASPAPAYRDYVEDAANGFVASSREEWVRALESIRRNPATASRMGEYGRRKAGELFSPEAIGAGMLGILRRVSLSPPPGGGTGSTLLRCGCPRAIMRVPDGDERDHGAGGEETMIGVQGGPSGSAPPTAATRPPDTRALTPFGAAPAVISAPTRFSVVLCTHNRAAYLRTAVESLFKLDYPADRFEIVVVDNRSADATPETAAALRRDAPVPMEYYREPKLGLSHARNTGIRHSRFDHIAYLDDDAAADGRWLSVFDETLRRYGADVVGGRVVPTPVEGYIPPDWFHSDYVWGFYGLDYARQGCAEKVFRVRFPRYLGGGCSCYRRELLSLPWARFHAGLGRTGKRLYQGEETLLNFFLERDCYQIFYNADAFIRHFIDPERVTRELVARKAFWGGYSDALMHRKMFGRSFAFRNGPVRFREALAAYREARGSGANGNALFEKKCLLLHDTGYLLRLLRFWGLR